MTENIEYREMRSGEEQEVCNLAKQVFNQYLAPDYDQEGINEFFRFTNPDAMKKRTQTEGFVKVAYQDDSIVGMIEFSPPNIIAMLFFSFQHHGIAKELLARSIFKIREIKPDLTRLIVHSSHYAETIYQKMGFLITGEETKENGIIYIPMELSLIDTTE